MLRSWNRVIDQKEKPQLFSLSPSVLKLQNIKWIQLNLVWTGLKDADDCKSSEASTADFLVLNNKHKVQQHWFMQQGNSSYLSYEVFSLFPTMILWIGVLTSSCVSVLKFMLCILFLVRREIRWHSYINPMLHGDPCLTAATIERATAKFCWKVSNSL